MSRRRNRAGHTIAFQRHVTSPRSSQVDRAHARCNLPPGYKPRHPTSAAGCAGPARGVARYVNPGIDSCPPVLRPCTSTDWLLTSLVCAKSLPLTHSDENNAIRGTEEYTAQSGRKGATSYRSLGYLSPHTQPKPPTTGSPRICTSRPRESSSTQAGRGIGCPPQQGRTGSPTPASERWSPVAPTKVGLCHLAQSQVTSASKNNVKKICRHPMGPPHLH